jgi:uncharacterized membrane protein
MNALPTQISSAGEDNAFSHVVERNMDALLAQRREAEAQKTSQERIADGITRFSGSMTFVYLHLIGFGLWIVTNLGWLPIPKFDPSFVILAMFASVEAIFISTFVMISQNRMQQIADKRADLDLHVSLLAEHEITRLIQLTTLMAAQMGIKEASNPELEKLAQDVHPEVVMHRIENGENGDNSESA